MYFCVARIGIWHRKNSYRVFSLPFLLYRHAIPRAGADHSRTGPRSLLWAAGMVPGYVWPPLAWPLRVINIVNCVCALSARSFAYFHLLMWLAATVLCKEKKSPKPWSISIDSPAFPRNCTVTNHASFESWRFKDSNELLFACIDGHYSLLGQPEEKSHVL